MRSKEFEFDRLRRSYANMEVSNVVLQGTNWRNVIILHAGEIFVLELSSTVFV